MTMDKKTLEALKGSIEKWEGIVAGKIKDEGPRNCPLCKKFPSCDGCPVSEVTLSDSCNNSPYEEWEIYAYANHHEFDYMVRDEKSKELAEAELNFLKSLLPEIET